MTWKMVEIVLNEYRLVFLLEMAIPMQHSEDTRDVYDADLPMCIQTTLDPFICFTGHSVK